MTEGKWVCGIDMGSLNTLSYVAWLKDSTFYLDLYVPSENQPLPEVPSFIQNVQYYAIDAPQGFPKHKRKRRCCDKKAQTPTKKLPQNLKEFEHWKLYKGLIEAGIKVFWWIHKSKDNFILGLTDFEGLPTIAETYPRKVAENLEFGRLPSKRKEPIRYVNHIWGKLSSQGYRCESVIRPSVDQIDAMLCAIAAKSLLCKKSVFLGEKPYIDEKEPLLREGFIVTPCGQV